MYYVDMKMSLKIGAKGTSVWKQRQKVGQMTMFSRHVHVRVGHQRSGA